MSDLQDLVLEAIISMAFGVGWLVSVLVDLGAACGVREGIAAAAQCRHKLHIRTRLKKTGSISER